MNVWKINPPHGDQQRKHSDTYALLRRAPFQHGGLASRQPAVISSHMPPPHNCCRPTVPHPRSVWLCTQKTRPENLGLALPSTIKDCTPQGFAYWHVPDYSAQKKKKKWERCSPTPTPDLLKSTAHSLCTHQSTFQLLPFEYKGPSERKRHLARAFQIKTAKQIFVWKCSKMRFNTLEKQRGDICSPR